jgi:hypothetical protein
LRSKDTYLCGGLVIHKLIARRVFKKTGVPNLPRVWVGPAFYGLDFHDKQRVVGVMAAHFYDRLEVRNVVLLYDGRSNKPIGKFNAIGLTLD